MKLIYKRFVFTVIGISLMLLPAVAQATNTYAVFNTSDCGSNLTITGSNLIVTHTGAASWRSCRVTIGIASGKYSAELTPASKGANIIGVCVANSTASLTNYLSVGADGWCYYSDGSKQTNNAGAGYGATWTNSDVVMVYFDATGGTVGFMKNGVDQGQAYSGLTGTLYVGISIFDQNPSFTGNFGATAFSGTPPAGYNTGVYTSSGGVVIPFSFFDIF